MSKLKIIDLLNMISKGEEAPKKIKFNEEVYKYHDKEHGYCKHHYDNTYICLNSEYYLFDILNDEVEIIDNDGNNYKAVEQYDLDGNYIATYKSSYEAEKMTGIGRTCIGGCCRNEHHTAGGYIWKFKNIEEDKKIEKLNVISWNDCIHDVTHTEKKILIEINKTQNKMNEIIDILNKEQ